MTRTATVETDVTIGATDYCVSYLLVQRFDPIGGEYDADADGPVRVQRYGDLDLEPVEWADLDDDTRRGILAGIRADAQREADLYALAASEPDPDDYE